MPAPRNQPDERTAVDFLKLCQQLAQLDTRQTDSLPAEIVKVVARLFETERVSLIILNQHHHTCCTASTGFKLDKGMLKSPGAVLTHVNSRLEPLFVYDVADHPEWQSAHSDQYRTDGFAVLPLVAPARGLAFLCISNLSAHQLLALENSPEQVELVLTQLVQLTSLLVETGEGPVSANELDLLQKLMHQLEHGVEVQATYAMFQRLLATSFPLSTLMVIHQQLAAGQRGVISLTAPANQLEVEERFQDLNHQWLQHQQRATPVAFNDVLIYGKDLLEEQSSSATAQELGKLLSFPIHLDNELYAVVGIMACDELLADQRKLQLFNILAYFLMLHIKKSQLHDQNQEMQTLDSLTGLLNERHFYRMMEREFERAMRYNVPLCLVVIDVDHFKDVNETYGFETGDLLLREISRILTESIRGTDLISRYSGEQFLLLLPETRIKNAEQTANRLRTFIENSSFFVPATNVFVKVTVSLGVTSYLEHNPTNLAQFIEFADRALYCAKREGRNMVVNYGDVVDLMPPGREKQGQG